MNRRDFFKAIGAGAVALYLPKGYSQDKGNIIIPINDQYGSSIIIPVSGTINGNNLYFNNGTGKVALPNLLDVNGDGNSNYRDAKIVSDAARGDPAEVLRSYTDSWKADVNGDGSNNLIDIVGIDRALQGDSTRVDPKIPSGKSLAYLVSVPSVGEYVGVKEQPVIVTRDGSSPVTLFKLEELTDVYAKGNYANLFDFLTRMTGVKEDARTSLDNIINPSSRFKPWSSVNIDFNDKATGSVHNYEGINYTSFGRQILQEINAFLGKNLINEGTNSNVKVGYTSPDGFVYRNPSSIDALFGADGKPASGVIAKQGFTTTEDELKKEWRMAFAKLLTLNNSLYEKMILDDKGAYKTDFKNLLRSLYGSGLVLDSNVYVGAERAPVAYAEVKTLNPKVGDEIIVDASKSKTFNSNIANYRIEQMHMGPDTLEYMTEWDWSNLENLGNGTFRLKADNQGTYWNRLTVTDSNGRKNTVEFPITVKPTEPSGLEYRVINMLDFKENDIVGLENESLNHILNNTGANTVEFVNTFWYTQAYPLPIISRLLNDSQYKISDQTIEHFLFNAKLKGLKRILSESIYPIIGGEFPRNDPKSSEWWTSWFNQVEPILLNQVDIAQRNNVEILNMYYIDLANLYDSRTEEIVLPKFELLLSKIKLKNSAKIGLTTVIGGTPQNPFNVAQYQSILSNNGIDVIFLNYNVKLYDESTPVFDIDTLSYLIKNSLFNKGNGKESFVDIANRLNKPIIFHLKWNSAKQQNNFNFFEVAADNSNIQKDLAEQVRLYEASFHVINMSELKGLFLGVSNHGFFWNDQYDIFYPPNKSIVPGSGELAESTRNKPVEKTLLNLW